MTGALLVTVGALYLVAVRRHDAGHPGASFPGRRVAWFLAGLAALTMALVGPVDRLAGERFSWHMAQHLLITMVAAPLLLLGRPVLLARRAAPPRIRRALTATLRGRTVHALTHPVVAWGVFVTVLWASHFTSLYQRALESEWVHAGEHAIYLAASLLFWLPVLAVEPGRQRIGHPARLLYLFAASAAGALLASTLYQSGRVLYQAYTGGGALADQRTAGAIMWIGGGLLMVAAELLVGASWARHDRREAERADLPVEQHRPHDLLGPGHDRRVAGLEGPRER